MATYVYIVQQGCYADRGIVGVYARPEAAMADHPVPSTTRNCVRPGGWKPDNAMEPDNGWDNGYDWDDAKDITRYEVQDVDALIGEPTS